MKVNRSARIDDSLASQLLIIMAVAIVAALAVGLLTRDIFLGVGTYMAVVAIGYAIPGGIQQ